MPGVERRPVGPKVGAGDGGLILGNDTGQVGRSQITQDLAGLRKGFGLCLREIGGRQICILGRWRWLLCVQQPGRVWSNSRWPRLPVRYKLIVVCPESELKELTP